ncbi:MAG: protein kinase domain-containing protein [Bacillota bacterium]
MISSLKELLNLPLKKGTLLNERYTIHRFIGQGSYGQVYTAKDQKTGQTVVIKQNRQRRGKDSEGMLLTEAQTLSMLNHPSIPKRMDLFKNGKKTCLVMEYIDGANFEDLILNCGHIYDEEESLSILLEVLSIVKYLHNQECIHRDLRLPNIIKNEQGIHIIDFGLAVFGEKAEPASSPNTASEKTLFREHSFKSDYYALGHFLLFLLYSDFQPESKQEHSWEEELNITPETRCLIKKMLRIDGSFQHINELYEDTAKVISLLGTEAPPRPM